MAYHQYCDALISNIYRTGNHDIYIGINATIPQLWMIVCYENNNDYNIDRHIHGITKNVTQTLIVGLERKTVNCWVFNTCEMYIMCISARQS